MNKKPLTQDELFVKAMANTKTEPDAMYQFTHKQSKRKIIARNWEQFFTMQSMKDVFDQSYQRLGLAREMKYFTEITSSSFFGRTTKRITDTETTINKFWEGAKGLEKAGQLNFTGWCFNPLRLVLKQIHNHACMQGDVATISKVKHSDKWWHHNSNHTQLALPMSTTV